MAERVTILTLVQLGETINECPFSVRVSADSPRFSEMDDWCSHPDQVGRFTWQSLTPAMVLVLDPNVIVQPTWLFRFSDPDTAFAFRMRWC